MPDIVPDDHSTATSPMTSPWVTTGGGFAVGLFTTFGVGALFQSDKYAFALTTFGFVSCLVLVIALATTQMVEIKRANGTMMPIGVWAAAILAVVSFGLGSVGAAIFFLAEVESPKLPTEAYYSTTGAAANGGIEPQLLVDGVPTDLSTDFVHPAQVYVQRNARIEVRVRGVSQVLSNAAANARVVNALLPPTPAAGGSDSRGPGEN